MTPPIPAQFPPNSCPLARPIPAQFLDTDAPAAFNIFNTWTRLQHGPRVELLQGEVVHPLCQAGKARALQVEARRPLVVHTRVPAGDGTRTRHARLRHQPRIPGGGRWTATLHHPRYLLSLHCTLVRNIKLATITPFCFVCLQLTCDEVSTRYWDSNRSLEGCRVHPVCCTPHILLPSLGF